MPADQSFGAMVLAAKEWADAYATCQAKHAGAVGAYDAARAEYLKMNEGN